MSTKKRKPAVPAVVVSKKVQVKIVRLYKKLAIKAVAEKVGLGAHVVTRILDAHGVARRIGGLTEKKRRAIAKRFFEGHVALTLVAHDFGVSCITVRNAAYAYYDKAEVREYVGSIPLVMHTEKDKKRAVALYTGGGMEKKRLSISYTAVVLAGEGIIMSITAVRRAVIAAKVLRPSLKVKEKITPETIREEKEAFLTGRKQGKPDACDRSCDSIASNAYDDDKSVTRISGSKYVPEVKVRSIRDYEEYSDADDEEAANANARAESAA